MRIGISASDASGEAPRPPAGSGRSSRPLDLARDRRARTSCGRGRQSPRRKRCRRPRARTRHARAASASRTCGVALGAQLTRSAPSRSRSISGVARRRFGAAAPWPPWRPPRRARAATVRPSVTGSLGWMLAMFQWVRSRIALRWSSGWCRSACRSGRRTARDGCGSARRRRRACPGAWRPACSAVPWCGPPGPARLCIFRLIVGIGLALLDLLHG